MTKLSIICACGILALVVSCVSSPRQISSETPGQTTDPLLASQPPKPTIDDIKIAGNKKITGDTNYDFNFAETVNQNWCGLLDRIPPKFFSGKGKVVLEFKLYPDGTVGELRIVSTTVAKGMTTICEKAVTKGSPYAPWTDKMYKALSHGTNMNVQYTFNYE